MSDQALRRLQQTGIAIVLALVGVNAGGDIFGAGVGNSDYASDKKFILEQLSSTTERLDQIAVQMTALVESQAGLAATLETWLRLNGGTE